MIDTCAGSQNLYLYAALLDRGNQRLARAAVGQEIRGGDADGVACAVDQGLKQDARLGASTMGSAGNDKAFNPFAYGTESELLWAGKNFSGRFEPVFAKGRYQAS